MKAPYYALRYMEQETQTLKTFAPTRDAYNLFAVAMKMTQIASSTRRALYNEVKAATALSIPKLDFHSPTVGADNIMQVVGLCDMSEYIQAVEHKEDCRDNHREQPGERRPDTKDVNTRNRKGMLKRITNMSRTEVHGDVLASRSCNWIKKWARQWDLEVTQVIAGTRGRATFHLWIKMDKSVWKGGHEWSTQEKYLNAMCTWTTRQ